MSKFTNYLKATRNEMKHVRWPTRKMAIAYSAIVIVVSTIVALYVAGFDFLFTEIIINRVF